jgi:hypothetical protein
VILQYEGQFHFSHPLTGNTYEFNNKLLIRTVRTVRLGYLPTGSAVMSPLENSEFYFTLHTVWCICIRYPEWWKLAKTSFFW